MLRVGHRIINFETSHLQTIHHASDDLQFRMELAHASLSHLDSGLQTLLRNLDLGKLGFEVNDFAILGVDALLELLDLRRAKRVAWRLAITS